VTRRAESISARFGVTMEACEPWARVDRNGKGPSRLAGTGVTPGPPGAANAASASALLRILRTWLLLDSGERGSGRRDSKVRCVNKRTGKSDQGSCFAALPVARGAA